MGATKATVLERSPPRVNAQPLLGCSLYIRCHLSTAVSILEIWMAGIINHQQCGASKNRFINGTVKQTFWYHCTSTCILSELLYGSDDHCRWIHTVHLRRLEVEGHTANQSPSLTLNHSVSKMLLQKQYYWTGSLTFQWLCSSNSNHHSFFLLIH